ncbi:hypothetical protein GUITHDRAFT_154245 [Guillardia theta CCMP2712]|uniref:6,7-dimethyl-8-ribityllumazine synthase n=1 Tax=Guillardia theta (strain CCMP2712) TaxID=905079 RepID=L1IW44_GUITC|nr:hypothetical protein GUITHDRAFT_154245 [Guillardia theta CCMP2712]EKX40114.1 hypothetical protein GUITHDRAFT_154245 [Guillardia theta CCMP2712]|eukprot:XP_005827094.1 hypothetical protein GUITHDRAFT_154245 [Guillardia theta CCMP2712]
MLRILIALAVCGHAAAFAPSLNPGRLALRKSQPCPLKPAHLPAILSDKQHSVPAVAQQATKGISFPQLDGKGMRVGIVSTRWNAEVVNKLKDGARAGLKECQVEDSNVVEFEVPGSWELPLACRYMAQTQKVDAIIAIGVLVKGETDHYDMIKDAATDALMMLGLETGIPVLNGILGCHTMEQAEARATGDNNHGVWWGKTAIEMATLRATQMGKGPIAASGVEKKKVLF